ncbi:MAG: adenosylcobalamin-dependent ribonucleoside-diphosphate reductase [Fulvivirga sp.]|uniref:adenosylcobalamin-dependent ribonucleoside-diphosphate reductase n=1 Tax=Fulvivirga sp. TaxID=1931237 RepID=UPI0032ECA7EF
MYSANSKKLLEARYLRRTSEGVINETPEGLFNRVATSISKSEYKYGGKTAVDHWHQVFYQMMVKLYFLPNSPTLMNAGLKKGQLSACFVLPVEDNTNAIFDTLHLAALIQRSGGGTGFNFSKIRPAGSLVTNSGLIASGPVGFMGLFDKMTDQIKQAGKRRGANMAILNIDHPDIEQFITSKSWNGELSNFNLSIGITDEFMHAVVSNNTWTLRHPANTQTKEISARLLWGQISENAWNTGDPGVLFLDAIERANPTPILGKITATNPCGEMPLLDYESCNLGSINLSKMIIQNSKKPAVDWLLLENTIMHAVRFLDDVIDANHYPKKILGQMARANRKIGLGVMGWAEMLIKLQIPYASAEAVELGRKIMSFIDKIGKQTSEDLAILKGSFPNWGKSIYFPDHPLRNATITSIAPTGSISIIANTSSSIEPLYGLAYEHHVLDGESLSEANEHVMQFIDKYKLDNGDLKKHILDYGSVASVKKIDKRVKKLFMVANEIPFKYHLLHQQIFQKHTDNAVSKTINLPENSTQDKIAEIFMQAWKMGLKGITVYRDGSKSDQVLQHSGSKIHKRKIVLEGCKICQLS